MVTKPKRKVAAKNPDALFGRVVSILEQARGNVVRAVNTNMVLAYWLIGREIVQELQGGERRAEYGEKIVEDLSARLTERYGKGFSQESLQFFRRFYVAYRERVVISCPLGTKSGDLGRLRLTAAPSSELTIPSPVGTKSDGTQILRPLGAESSVSSIPSPLGIELARPEKSYPAGSPLPQGFSPQLSWSHYRALMRVDKIEARDFYEREAAAGAWDKRTLERQIQSFYNETVARYSALNDRKTIFAYQTGGDGVEVRVQHGTIWLSQKSIGLLFETTPENVLMHLKKIYAENELPEAATTNEFLAVQTEGKRQVQRRHTQGVAMGGLRMPLRGAVSCRGILGNCRRLQELHGYAQ